MRSSALQHQKRAGARRRWVETAGPAARQWRYHHHHHHHQQQVKGFQEALLWAGSRAAVELQSAPVVGVAASGKPNHR
jgi:hypothetical protein